MNIPKQSALIFAAMLAIATSSSAHSRRSGFTPVPANLDPPVPSEFTLRDEGEWRLITANGIPNHKVGRFPNGRNPGVIRVQRLRYAIPAKPVVAERVTPLMHAHFAIALSGVPLDPETGEFWSGRHDWNYEAIGGSGSDLGIDTNDAHVQPDGTYHYHGIPMRCWTNSPAGNAS